MTKKQYIILSFLFILLLVSSFFVYQDTQTNKSGSQEEIANLEDSDLEFVYQDAQTNKSGSQEEIANLEDSDLEDENSSSSLERGNNAISELASVDNIESFWPKIRSCEVGESTTYDFEVEINMFGLELYTYTKNKVDILSKEETECEISFEIIEKYARVLNEEEVSKISQEFIDESFLEMEDYFVNDYGMTEEKFIYLFNTKIKNISQENKDLLIEEGLNSALFLEEYNEETIFEQTSRMMKKQFEELTSDYKDTELSKQICTGQPEALIDFLNFQTSEDGSLSVSCSTNMICEYENGVECLQIVD